ncbi:MAG: hypothetical protein K1X89_08275 [Myxococcaceae bacterium]|nr:hypothetical protein [Myxococcaceae bacterium]
MRRHLRVADALTAVAFAAFFAFVVVSNDFDWDHFLAATEVDLRAWLVDHEAPLWSYQLCGGVTRLGDPQASGLSPLFAVVLLFGSFWGLKLLVLGLALVGFLALSRTLEVVARPGGIGRPGPATRGLLRSLSAAYVLGNFFLWHAHHGHVTFALGHLALVLVALVVTALVRPLTWRRGALAVGASFTFFSAGFYGALVFFLLPVTVALAGWVAWLLFQRRGAEVKRTLTMAGLAALGLGLAAYKPLGVLAYQGAFPRVVTAAPAEGVDGTTPWHTLVYQLVPSFDYQFAGLWRGAGPYALWEYSAFTLDAWLCVVGAGALVVARRRRAVRERAWVVLGALLVAVASLFALGDHASWSLLSLLNVPLEHSVRVAGRFQGVLPLAWAVLGAVLLGRLPALRRAYFRQALWLVPALLTLNLATFRASLRPGSAAEVLSQPAEPLARMHALVTVKPRALTASFMGAAVQSGLGVLNCYDPLARDHRMTSEKIPVQPELRDASGALRTGVLLPLVEPAPGPGAEACREDSHFTQQEVVLSDACAPGTCVNLNGLDLYRPQHLVLDPARGKFCLP